MGLPSFLVLPVPTLKSNEKYLFEFPWAKKEKNKKNGQNPKLRNFGHIVLQLAELHKILTLFC